MNGRSNLLGIVLLGLSLGCADTKQSTALVPHNPFSSGTAMPPPANELSPESREECLRVTRVGNQLLESNSQLPIKPHVRFAGNPVGGPAPTDDSRTLALFHRGSEEIWISEGLSRKCSSDGQLYALLAYELGKIMSERESMQRFSPVVGNGAPPDVRVGNDCNGQFGFTDSTRMMEVGKMEEERHRRPATPPRSLALIYLQKAGLSAELMTEVAPLIKNVEDNVSPLEKQMTDHKPFSLPFLFGGR